MAAKKGRKKTAKRRPASKRKAVRKPNVEAVFKELESTAQKIVGHINTLKKRIKMGDCMQPRKPKKAGDGNGDCMEIGKPHTAMGDCLEIDKG
ncbi:MAG: hypothetical protein ACYDAB_10505 [bacterium]